MSTFDTKEPPLLIPSHSTKLWRLIGVFSLSGVLFVAPSAPAQETQSSPKPEDASGFLMLGRTQRAFKAKLELKIEKATVEDVVVRLQKEVTTRQLPLLPPIEIRGVKPVRLSFSVKGSSIGEVLSAAAILAGARLWLLKDHALIAPIEALTAKEVSDEKQGMSLHWTSQGIASNPRTEMEKKKTLSSFVAREIGGKLKAIGTTGTGKMAFGQLSADSQAILQELIDDVKTGVKTHPSSTPVEKWGFDLSATAQVEVGPHDNRELTVSFPPSRAVITWSLDGMGLMVIGDSPQSAAAPSIQLPFDPSAGKS